MFLFHLKDKKFISVNEKPFKLEKEIQYYPKHVKPMTKPL